MAAKQLKYDTDARQSVLAGVQKLAKAGSAPRRSPRTA